MPEFNLIPEARSSPTECALCRDHRGPFIDTGIEKLDGRILICTSITGPDGNLDRAGCIEQMARLVGSVDKETHAELQTRHQDMKTRVHELEAVVKDGKAPAADLSKIIGRLEKVAVKFEGATK